MYSKLTRI